MKTAASVIALFAVVIGGVFVVTFLKQYTKNDTPSSSQNDPTPPRVQLFESAEKKADWDSIFGLPPKSDYKLEVEKGGKGHYDFLVKTVNEKPITATLRINFNCTCLNPSVQVAVLSVAQRGRLKSLEKAPTGPKIEQYLEGAQWQPVHQDLKNVSPEMTIPPAENDLPQYFAVRIGWETKDYKSTNILAELHGKMGQKPDYMTFDVPLTVTPPIMASQQDIQLGDIKSGEKREADIVLWSPTREQHPVQLRLATDDPCIQLSAPRPLTPDELKRLPFDLLEKRMLPMMTRPKCGYLVRVTVNESLGDQQLELGPLARRVVVNRGTDTEVTLVLHATVRGSINVGEDSERDRVNLGVFNAHRGLEKVVQIISPDPSLQLAIDRIRPESLKVELEDAKAGLGMKRWKLKVTAPGDTFGGPLPGDSAIYLKTMTSPPRRIRIPVQGNASG